MGREETVRVLIADDEAEFADALEAVLEDGIAATRRIREELRGTRVLVVTGTPWYADAEQARSAGASGYLTKDRVADELVGAVFAVVGGPQGLS